jgi:hypothetical protein
MAQSVVAIRFSIPAMISLVCGLCALAFAIAVIRRRWRRKRGERGFDVVEPTAEAENAIR